MGKVVNAPDCCKDLVKALRSIANSHSIQDVFQDWLAISAIAISNAVDKSQWERREEIYLQLIAKYSKPEQEKLAEALGQLVLALEHEMSIHGPTDVLGQVFHALGLHSKYKGQFFTPPHICEFMGHIVLTREDLATMIDKKSYITVCEPCIGSGGMVLGAAKAMADLKLNYQTNMLVTGIDIDLKCVHMAYLQLSLLGIPAVVIHGNSLTNEVWSHWYTPAYILGHWATKEQEAPLADVLTSAKEQATALCGRHPKNEV